MRFPSGDHAPCEASRRSSRGVPPPEDTTYRAGLKSSSFPPSVLRVYRIRSAVGDQAGASMKTAGSSSSW
jgi:hypothetical protein